MGLYIRKSISVGPFRFNLSKSGFGVSAGVKGLRVGTGPRGKSVLEQMVFIIVRLFRLVLRNELSTTHSAQLSRVLRSTDSRTTERN